MKGKAILGVGGVFVGLAVIVLIVSIVTLVNDGDLSCTFSNNICDSSYRYENPDDPTFCCDIYGFCYAKFYCNGDEFVVNGLRYVAIGCVILGIVLMIVGCRKMNQEKRMAGFAAPLVVQQGNPNQGQNPYGQQGYGQ